MFWSTNKVFQSYFQRFFQELFPKVSQRIVPRVISKASAESSFSSFAWVHEFTMDMLHGLILPMESRFCCADWCGSKNCVNVVVNSTWEATKKQDHRLHFFAQKGSRPSQMIYSTTKKSLYSDTCFFNLWQHGPLKAIDCWPDHRCQWLDETIPCLVQRVWQIRFGKHADTQITCQLEDSPWHWLACWPSSSFHETFESGQGQHLAQPEVENRTGKNPKRSVSYQFQQECRWSILRHDGH